MVAGTEERFPAFGRFVTCNLEEIFNYYTTSTEQNVVHDKISIGNRFQGLTYSRWSLPLAQWQSYRHLYFPQGQCLRSDDSCEERRYGAREARSTGFDFVNRIWPNLGEFEIKIASFMKIFAYDADITLVWEAYSESSKNASFGLNGVLTTNRLWDTDCWEFRDWHT